MAVFKIKLAVLMKIGTFMSFRIKKLSVLHQLSQESAPIGLHELLEKLGSNYTERSVRRWLAEMIKEGLIEKLGNKRGTKYKVIQNISHKDIPDSCFSQKSKKIRTDTAPHL